MGNDPAAVYVHLTGLPMTLAGNNASVGCVPVCCNHGVVYLDPGDLIGSAMALGTDDTGQSRTMGGHLAIAEGDIVYCTGVAHPARQHSGTLTFAADPGTSQVQISERTAQVTEQAGLQVTNGTVLAVVMTGKDQRTAGVDQGSVEIAGLHIVGV